MNNKYVDNKEMKNLIKKARALAKPFCITDDRFRLKDVDPGATLQFASEDKPREIGRASCRERV